MKTIKPILILFLLVTALKSGVSQETVLATGGTIHGTNGQIACSVGQVFFKPDNFMNLSVHKGIQLPYDFFTGDGIHENQLSLPCRVFPNPVTTALTILLENYRNEDFRYQLFDLWGNLLRTEKIVSSRTRLSFDDLIPTVYFLKITENNHSTTAFKIIKNK